MNPLYFNIITLFENAQIMSPRLQNIFYKRSDVLTLSIHGNPHDSFPFFSGFEDEIGEDEGEGFNINYPMPAILPFPKYEKKLVEALNKIKDYKTQFLIKFFINHGLVNILFRPQWKVIKNSNKSPFEI